MSERKKYTGLLANPHNEADTFKLVGRTKEAYELLDAQESDVILDLGCKGSWLENLLHDKVRKIVATDLDETYIQHNQKTNKYENVEYQVADATKKSDFRANSFSKVALLEVIEHVPEDTEFDMIEEIHRVLKPQGILILTTPRYNWLSNLFDPAYWLIGHRHYREQQIYKYLSDAGFSDIKIYIKGRFFDAFAVFTYYFLKIFKLDKLTHDTMIAWVQREYDRGAGFNHIIVKAQK